MYYRRKILLSLIEAAGGSLEKLRLQKLLFLACQQQGKPSFHFVPYKFGCFSFQANADLGTMKKMNMLQETITDWKLHQISKDQTTVTVDDQQIINVILQQFSNIDTDTIIKYTYLNFPFYAINSQILQRVLSTDEQRKVACSKVNKTSPLLLSIGYEGKSLEQFINVLIKQDIKLLCDVRKNAMSMKYGFSKSTLLNACQNVGIAYKHYPDLGIDSAERTELKTQSDYDALFLQYKKTVLVRTSEQQKSIWEDFSKANRAALMCFEAKPEMCHRTHLLKHLISTFNTAIPSENA